MIKKSLKLFLTISIIMITIFSFSICFASDADLLTTVHPSEDQSTEEVTDEANENEIYNGDLYIYDTKVVMDKLVDGNVFIFGNDVEITGQVNGNLFVFANNLKFDGSYIRYDIFAYATSVYYNGACNDLYVATNNLEMTYDSYVVRDLKAVTSDFIFKAAVGRDADLAFNTINLGEGEDIPIIYGNLRYKSSKEVEIPEGILTSNGTATFSNKSTTPTSTSISSILIAFFSYVITAIIIYILIKTLSPKLLEKLSDNKKFSIIKLLKYIGIGFLSIILVSILCILLLLTKVGIKISILLALAFIFICIISLPLFTISITNLLKSKFKLEKMPIYLLVLSLINIIIYGITFIPFAGGFISLIIVLISIGMLIDLFIPKKELSDEEKEAKQLKKQQAKELSEQKKKEKAELKQAKKEAKKENKNKNE